MIKPKRHLIGAFAAAVAMVVSMAPPASAELPDKRLVEDAVEPGKAFDIVGVVLRSAPSDNQPASVTVRHGRDERVGDSIDMWFNLDDDAQPDVHIVGDAGSEYRVYKTDSFVEDGKEISNRGCYAMSIREDRTKVKFDPHCLKVSEKFGVAVRTSRFDRPATANDWVRGPRKFTKKVLANAAA